LYHELGTEQYFEFVILISYPESISTGFREQVRLPIDFFAAVYMMMMIAIIITLGEIM